MTIEIELFNDDDEAFTVKLPSEWVVCPNCNGEGKHVHRAIDSHGLTREDFDADPDFEEDYFSGRYDVQCDLCKGRTTVQQVDEAACRHLGLSSELEHFRAQQREESEYRSLCEWERRMGC